MRTVHLVAVLGMLALMVGCGKPPRPPNPVLENAQDRLQAVELRLHEGGELTHADHLELGMARYRVWSIHLGRSKYPGGRGKRRREAERNRRHAERMQEAKGGKGDRLLFCCSNRGNGGQTVFHDDDD